MCVVLGIVMVLGFRFRCVMKWCIGVRGGL